MIPLTPSFVIAASAAFVGLKEQGGNNRGLMIELFLKGVKQPPGQPWCAAFVHHVGYWAHYDYDAERSTWPLPATASCYLLGQFARERNVLMEAPKDGDVFLLFSPMKARFAHTGIIANVRETGATPRGSVWYDCDTIEGNTTDEGKREGWGVLRRKRRFYPACGDRFIRWVDLDERWKAGNPLQPKKVA